ASPPVAVRAFLVESTHLSRLALVYVALAGLAVPLLALRFVPATEHAPRLLAAGCIAWLLMLPAGVLLSRVRRFCRAGFAWGGVALVAAVLARARTAHRTDPRGERRLRFWRGPLGRCLFKIAGWGGRPARAPTAVGDAARPSPEMAIGVLEDGRGGRGR